MTPTEFVLWFVYIPWGLCFISVFGFLFTVILGGETLRTLIMGRLDKRTHFALAVSDGGGAASLKRYHFDGTHGVLEREEGKRMEFLPFTTPLSDKDYTPNLLVAQPNATDEQRQLIDEENDRRRAEADRLNHEYPLLNEMAKKRSTLEGRPLWLVHTGKNVAEPPSMVYLQEKAKQYKNAPIVTPVELVSVDTIKDFFTANFSRDRLWSIFQKGRDVEAYGRPKKPLNPLILILGAVAVIFILGGVLILTGGVDFSGWLKGLGVMR